MDNSGMGSVIRRLRTERGWTQEALEKWTDGLGKAP